MRGGGGDITYQDYIATFSYASIVLQRIHLYELYGVTWRGGGGDAASPVVEGAENDVW